MNRSITSIIDLPNEIILTIWDYLNQIDILHSFIGINNRFNKLARRIFYNCSIQLIQTNSEGGICSLPDSILDRYCFDILPQLSSDIQCLTLEPQSMERILLATNYPRLKKLILLNLDQQWALHYLNGIN